MPRIKKKNIDEENLSEISEKDVGNCFYLFTILKTYYIDVLTNM